MANQDFRVKNGLQVGLGASVVGIVTAESFSGSAVGLTSVPSASLTGTISSERLSGTYDIDILGTVSGSTINVTTATVTEQLNVGAGDTGVFATATDGTLSVSGVSTFKDTTDNTLGDATTGAVQIRGGLGISSNVTVGGGLSVTGDSYFVGMVTFASGTDGNISIGDSAGDNVIINAQIDSDLIPDDDGTYDLGSSTKEWQDLYIDGTANIDSLAADTAAIGDLTDNQVVVAGTSGELEGDANLTYDGTELIVGTATTGSVVRTDGTLNVSGVSTFQDRVIFDSTNSIQIPVGTDAEKDAVGTAVTGQIRYNTTNSQFEGFGPGNDWGSLGGVKDVDGDTYVKPESSPGSDEDALTFFTAGTERAVIDSDGKVGIGTTNPTATLDLDGTQNVSGISTFQDRVIFDSTNSIQIPVGSTAERDTVGTAVTGQIRYNTTLSSFEGYGPGGEWGTLGGVKDIDQDTYITAQKDLSVDDDALRFYTNGTEQVSIDSTGKVGIGSTQPTSTLDLDGTLNVTGISTFHDDVNIGIGGTVAFFDISAGKVGVGTLPSGTSGRISLPTEKVPGGKDALISAGNQLTNYGLYVADDSDNTNANHRQEYVRQYTSKHYTVSVGADKAFRVSNSASFNISATNAPGGMPDGEVAFVVSPDTSTELRYNYSKKLETTTDGFKVLNGTSETAVISGPQNIILDPSPDDVVAIVEGDISAAGVSTITGITTTNIAVGNLIQEVDGVISAGTTVTSVGISSLTISNVSLGAATNQEFTFANQTPTGIVRIKGDLYVDGTRTEINSTTLTVDDLNVVVASGATNGLTADTAGLTVDGANAYLKYNYNAGTNETWELNKNVGIGTDNATAKLDVDGTLNVSGVSTFASDLDINASVDISTNLTVDGLSDLDELNVSGISTFSDDLIVGTATTGVVARTDGTLNVSGVSTFLGNVNIGTAATSVNLPGLYLKGLSDETNVIQNPSISIGGTTSKYYDIYVVDDPDVQYVRHYSNGFDYNISVPDARQFVVSNTTGFNSLLDPGVLDNEIAFKIVPNASTELRYNKVKKLETTGYGVSVTGGLDVSGISTFRGNVSIAGTERRLNLDAENDAVNIVQKPKIHIDGATSSRYYKIYALDSSPVQYIRHHAWDLDFNISVSDDRTFLVSGGGSFTQQSGSLGILDDKIAFKIVPESSTELRFNKEKRFETTGYGVSVTGGLDVSGISTFGSDLDINADVNVSGIVTAQLFSGNGGSLTNVSAFEAYKSDISERAFKTDEISGSLVYAYDGQRFSNLGTGTGSSDGFAIKSVISKDGKVAFVSEYDTTNTSLNSGRVHIYERTGANFTAIGIVTQTSHSSPGAAQTTTCFGPIIACNADGSIFAVGSPQGNYNGSSNLSWWHTSPGPGQQSVHIFQKNGSTITNIGILTSPSPGSDSNGDDSFGGALAFSDDGSRLYVGSPRRDDASDGNGGIFVYDKSGTTYNYVGIVTTSTSLFDFGGGVGQGLACSSDGNILFAGWPTAYRPNSGGSGQSSSGVIEIYDRSGSNFTNIGIVSSGYYLSGANSGNVIGEDFGNEIACSDDGTYLYSISHEPGIGAEQYAHGKLHLFKRESNTYSEVSSDILDSPVVVDNRLGWGLACSSDGSKVIAGECNLVSSGTTGYVHYYARVGDGIVRVGFATAGIAQGGSYQFATFGFSVDLSGSGEVGIVGSPYQEYVNLGDGGSVFFLKETRGTTVYSDILTGNIGIKTASPKATLDVNGTLNVSGIATAQKFVGDGSQLRSLSTNELVTYASHADSSYSSSQVSAISGYRQVGAAVTHGYTHNDPSFANFETRCSADGKIFAVSAHEDTETAGSGYGVVHVYERHANSNTRIGILTGSYASDAGDRFGTGIALSADGKTIVVGADADETPETGSSDGVAYVFDFIDGEYKQVGILTSPEPSNYRGRFGASIAMSSNGKIIYVGAYQDTFYDGAVHCFDRDGDQFNYVGFVTTAEYSNTANNFGYSIDCTPDGKRLVASAIGQTYNPNFQFGFTGTNKGVVYVYDRIEDNFENVGILTSHYDYAYNTSFGGSFGIEVQISADGNTIAASSAQDMGDSRTHEANGGTVYIFDHKHRGTRIGLTGDAGTSEWVNTAALWPQDAGDIYELYGRALALSADGNLVAVGAPGMSGDDYSSTDSGVVYVYKRDTPDTIGIQTGHGYQFTKCAKFTQADVTSFYLYGGFGYTLDMSADGKSIIVGRWSSGGNGEAAAYIFDQITKTYLSTSSRTGSVHFKEEHLSRIGDNGLNEDFGLNWNKVELDTYTGSNADNYTTIRALEYCGNGIVLAGVGSTAVGTADSGTIYRSTDYGKTWQNMNTNLITEGNSAYVKTIEYCGNGIVLAGVTTAIEGTTNGFQLLRSTDYGQNWNNLVIVGNTLNPPYIPDQCDAVNDLVYIGDGKIIAGVNTGRDLYQSNDYGLTWSWLAIDGGGADFDTTLTVEYCGRGHEDKDGEGIVLIAGGDRNGTDSTYQAGNAFVVTYENPHRTSGSYSSWQPRTSIDPNVTRINVLKYCENDIVLAGTASATNDYALFRSTDYGKSWNNITSYLPSWSSTEIRTIEYCGNGIIFAGSLSSPNATLYKSTDFGFTWELVSVSVTGSSIESIKYCGGDVIFSMDNGTLAGDQGCIFRSDSGFAEGQSLQGVYHQNKTGNIGIGSTQPTAKLDVNGDINVGAAVSLRAAYSGGTYPSDRLYITSTDPSRPGSIAIGTHGNWAGQNLSDIDIIMEAKDTAFNFANIEISQVNSNQPLLEISSVQETSGLLREYSEIIQYKGDLTLLAHEDDSSIIFAYGNSGAQVIEDNDKPLVKLNVKPSGSVDENIVLGGEMTITPVGGGVTIGGNVDISGITTVGKIVTDPTPISGIATLAVFGESGETNKITIETEGPSGSRLPYVTSTDTLWLSPSNGVKISNYVGNKTSLEANAGAAVSMYYDNSKKLETTTNGIDVGGDINVTGAASSITFDPSTNNSRTFFIRGEGNGNATIENDDEMYVSSTHLYIQNPGGTTTMAEFIQDGAVKLNHNNSTKLQTHDYGIDVTGRVETDTLNVSGIATAQKFIGDGSELTNLPPAGSDLVTYASASNIANSAESISGISNYIQLDSLLASQTAGAGRPWNFGNNNAMSADASTLIVGAREGTLNGIFDNIGVVYVFDREGNSYREVGILTASEYAGDLDHFGYSVACSNDGRRIIVGAYGDEVTGSESDSGVVYVFDRNPDDTFTRVGILTGSYASDEDDYFGYGVDCSGDGNVIAVGARHDETGATGSTGVVYVFDRSGNNFTEVGIITTTSNAANDDFGFRVSISDDGNTIVASASGDGSNDEGIVYVFDRVGVNTFTQVGILTGFPYADDGSDFGNDVKISSNGKTIVVGCGAAEINEAVTSTGLVHVFDRNPDNTFTRVGVLTGSHASQSDDYFGSYIDVSADGNTIAVGAYFDELTGGNAVDDDDGLGYIFTRQGDTFEEVSTFIRGRMPALSADGKTVAFGDSAYESGGSGAGRVVIYEQQRQTYLHSTSTGNIGIGVTNPTAKLDVNGTLNVSGVSTFTVSGIGTEWPYASGEGTAIRIKAHPIASYDSTGNGSVSVLDWARHQAGRFPANVSIANTLGTAGINFSDGDIVREQGGDTQYSGSFTIFTRNTTYNAADNYIWASPYHGIHVGYSTAGGANSSEYGFVIKKTKVDGNGTPTTIFKIQSSTDNLIFSGNNVGIGSDNPTAKLDVDGSIAIKNHSIVSITTSHTASAGTPFTIDTFATSENDLAEYTIHVGYGNTIQAQKVLVMHDGTTAYSQEYAVMSQPSKIVSIEALVSGSNVLLRATPESGVSGITTYKIVRGGLV